MLNSCHAAPHLPACCCTLPIASAVPPAGRTLDAAESLLVKCRPLSTQWGRERFGLVDTSVLQALEVSLGWV